MITYTKELVLIMIVPWKLVAGDFHVSGAERNLATTNVKMIAAFKDFCDG